MKPEPTGYLREAEIQSDLDGAYLTSAKIHGGADGVSWAAEGLDKTLDETATLPVTPADWLDGLPMLANPWARALGEYTEPATPPVRGWFKRHPDKRRGRHRR